MKISRHTPTVLGTSGALRVGWDTPQSIKIGHAHVGIILRPPRRCSIRQYMHMWAKFRLPSTESLKTKRAWSEGGERWFRHGEGVLMECFLHTRDPHSPSCGHFHTHFQKTQISRNAGMRYKGDEGWSKQWWWWWGEDKTSRPIRM